jgi:hypothetical protein
LQLWVPVTNEKVFGGRAKSKQYRDKREVNR